MRQHRACDDRETRDLNRRASDSRRNHVRASDDQRLRLKDGIRAIAQRRPQAHCGAMIGQQQLPGSAPGFQVDCPHRSGTGTVARTGVRRHFIRQIKSAQRRVINGHAATSAAAT